MCGRKSLGIKCLVAGKIFLPWKQNDTFSFNPRVKQLSKLKFIIIPANNIYKNMFLKQNNSDMTNMNLMKT